MIVKKILPMCFVIILLTVVIALTAQKNQTGNVLETAVISEITQQTDAQENSDKSDLGGDVTTENTSEMRGVWISYLELSMENESDKSEKAFTEKFNTIAICCKENGFNTLVVQVRPFCDALYKSEYFPYSHILTGTQGKNPEYDPLEIMCNICKENDLQIHAWINPYRVSSAKTPAKLSNDNPYVKNKSMGFETESGIFLNPANSEAQELIINGITEIIKNYDVDAIQFDDYFYPPDMGNQDKESYQEYLNNIGSDNNSMDIENWRKANVSLLICNIYRTIHNTSNNIEFGISPQGNIYNNDKLYADVKLWCSCKGYIDYICPQIYFSLENPALTFENSLESWSNLDYADNVKLYIGLAGYKAGTDNDSNTWKNSDDILSQEYEIIKNNQIANGFMLYSYNSLTAETSSSEISNLTKKLN